MEIKEKIKGALYGMALGDALGLGTEFMTQDEVKHYYPDGLTHFNQFVRDFHRSQYKAGAWTHDTEVVLRMLEAVIEDGRVDVIHIARKMKEWYNEHPSDLNTPYRVVMSQEGWEDNPIVMSHRAWRTNKVLDASNEALNRALIIGLFADAEVPISEMSRRLVNITHDDSRCVATTAVAACFIHSYFHKDREPNFERVWNMCHDIDERALEYIRIAQHGTLADFKIDDEETWWYSRKSLGVVLWALWNCETPAALLHTLVHAGGDSDTNASLGLMIMGMKYGYAALPSLKEEILDKERLDDMAERLTAVIEKWKETHNPIPDKMIWEF